MTPRMSPIKQRMKSTKSVRKRPNSHSYNTSKVLNHPPALISSLSHFNLTRAFTTATPTANQRTALSSRRAFTPSKASSSNTRFTPITKYQSSTTSSTVLARSLRRTTTRDHWIILLNLRTIETLSKETLSTRMRSRSTKTRSLMRRMIL